MAASAAFMTFLGIWACRWRELRPINFGGQHPEPPVADGGEGASGRGRHRGDQQGDYEMVAMKDASENV
jgi:protein SYS1